ncbi:MAG TPA: Sir2 family NAD-dependent protein deacetylase [Clostridia bacterium]|nr:Sir2 family NAD-dependent protein deacetylase [Clostridia bacterium]
MLDLVAITGAGISRASGIPTFVEMGDLREKLNRDYFRAHPDKFYKIILDMKRTIDRAQPNAAHRALAEYGVPVITMNIDGLHTRAGSEKVLEVHGNLDYVECLRCNTRHGYNEVEESIYCKKCGSIYEPNVVLYGDSIRYFYEAIELASSCSQVLVVGTSFYTSTVNVFVDSARMAGVKIHVINKDAEHKVPGFLKDLDSKA